MNKHLNKLAPYLGYLLVPMVLFFSLARLGHQPVHQWDEARTGINAIEMLEYGDWINLHFGGEPDKIRAKPPLVIWWVALNFKIFGKNTFSLRLHSALSSVLIFFFFYRIVRLYKDEFFAFSCCLVLLSVRGILGFHVGRTGDFDATLTAFLLAGLYFFLRYLHNNHRPSIYLAGIFWGLAFLTKGPAMGVLFPGLFLFLLLTRQLKSLLTKREIYTAAGICLLFPIGWYLTIHFYGVQLEKPEVSGSNAFERMFLYDLLDRFTQTEFEGKTEIADPLFLIHYLRENFKIWNYFFYLACLGGIVQYFRKRPKLRDNQLIVLSTCIWLSLGLFLSVVTTAKFWYLAPAIPFIALTTVAGFEVVARKFTYVWVLFLGIWVFAMYIRYFGPKPEATAGSKAPDYFTSLVNNNKDIIKKADRILVPYELPAQRVLLSLYFQNDNLIYWRNEKAPLEDNTILFSRKKNYSTPLEYPVGTQLIEEDQYYVLLKK